jgi:hypothetical protein
MLDVLIADRDGEMAQQEPDLQDDDDDDDFTSDHNKRIQPAMRQMLATRIAGLLSPKELLGMRDIHAVFPNDQRMVQGYTQIHEDVKTMLQLQPRLWVNKQGTPCIPTRRACREAAQRWGLRFLQHCSVADYPAHAPGWRNTPKRLGLLRQMVQHLAEGWVVNQADIVEQEKAVKEAEEHGLQPPEVDDEQIAAYADLQHAINTSESIRKLRDQIAETKLTSLDGLRRALHAVSKDLGYEMFSGDTKTKKSRDFPITRVRAFDLQACLRHVAVELLRSHIAV